MRLVCKSRYSGSVPTRVERPNGMLYGFELAAYAEGDVIDVEDEIAAFLLRDSPGSFEESKPKPKPKSKPDASAMSTETETGVVAPDRRARGGRKRSK